ncbi:MAG: cytochrome C oxidase subunit IV family protein [Elusimicrobia bacterium]|nr:cytochrome C oxidase subunit IV family protein [Elusimicrobiota bacterium]
MSKNPDAATHDEHRPNVALYVKVFAALMVLTLITVAISKIHLPRPQAVALGVFVALVKASLVGALFMHLWGENKLIHKALWITVGLGAALILPMLDFVLLAGRVTSPADVANQHPGGHETDKEKAAESAEPMKAEH